MMMLLLLMINVDIYYSHYYYLNNDSAMLHCQCRVVELVEFGASIREVEKCLKVNITINIQGTIQIHKVSLV